MRIFLVVLFLLSSTLWGGEWHVDKNAKNQVKFLSKVVVLEFEGVTDQIDGYLFWEGEALFKNNSQVLFEVDLNAVETGNGKRDRDMRDVLKTSEWQYTSFKGEIIDVQKRQSEEKYDIRAKGKMFIHGVEQEIEVPGVISREGDQWRVKARWQILLNDYNIEAPSLAAFVKVAQEIDLMVDFYLKEAK